jgi:hypothetical protein
MADSDRDLPDELNPAWERQFSLRGLLIYVTAFAVLLSAARIALAAPLFALAWLMAVGGWLGFGIAFLFGRRHSAPACALIGACLPVLLLFLWGVSIIALMGRATYSKIFLAPPQQVSQPVIREDTPESPPANPAILDELDRILDEPGSLSTPDQAPE